MINDNLSLQTISETTAIRLYNSVATADSIMDYQLSIIPAHRRLNNSDKSITSVHSANEYGQSCRICRWNRSDMEVTRCPCLCKGTVGFIHLQCLKRWIMHRKDNHCEICHGSFIMPEEKISIGRMFSNFYRKCGGPIVKHALFGISLLPLANIVLQQVMLCMDKINQIPLDQKLSVSEIVLASCALVTSSALFFHYFEFITARLLTIRYILRHWWTFGNASDFSMIEIDSDIIQLFN